MDEPVSVVIPAWNRASLLKRAVESVLAQEYPAFEVVVVDDGSTDDTAALLRSLGPPVRYLWQPQQGVAAARNTGIKAARHRLLAFLDSDDWFHPRKLALQAAAMTANPDLLVSHTQEVWYRRGQHLNQKKKHRKEGGDIFARSLRLCVVGMSTVMARRELFVRYGLFDEHLPCCEDYDLWLRVGCAEPFLLVDAPLTFKDGGREDQLSVRYRQGMDRYRILSLSKLLDSGRLSPAQRQLAVAELARKCTIYGRGCLKHGRPEEGRQYLELAQRYLAREAAFACR